MSSSDAGNLEQDRSRSSGQDPMRAHLLVTWHTNQSLLCNGVKQMRRTAIAAVAISLTALAGCSGTISSPSVAPPTGVGVACPILPPLVRTGCPGISIATPNLTCGGDGKMSVALSTMTGGGTRFVVQLPTGSELTGPVTRYNMACEPAIPSRKDAKLGVVYTGDQETETAANGTTSPCIVRSKIEFTQYETQEPELSRTVMSIKDLVRQAIDDAVINQVFVTQLFVTPGSSSLPGRCARWRAL